MLLFNERIPCSKTNCVLVGACLQFQYVKCACLLLACFIFKPKIKIVYTKPQTIVWGIFKNSKKCKHANETLEELLHDYSSYNR